MAPRHSITLFLMLIFVVPASAQWRAGASKDEIKKEETSFLYLNAYYGKISKPRRSVDESKRGQMFISCVEGNKNEYINILIGFPGELVSHRKTRFIYRFDDDKAKTLNVSGSESHEFAGIWRVRPTHEFLKRMKSARSLLVRTEEPVWGETESHFTVEGFDKVFQKEYLKCLR